MKQQKQPSTKPSRVPTDAPEIPRFPQVKTVGGDADRVAIERHNQEMDNWHQQTRTRQTTQMEAILGRLDTLEEKVTALQKQLNGATS